MRNDLNLTDTLGCPFFIDGVDNAEVVMITLCVILCRRKQGVGLKVFKNAWFGRFARKERIPADALWDAVERAEKGQIDADLGGGVIKQRIARPGEGKSKGYRSIVLFRKGEVSFFVYGFSKSEIGNIREDEDEQFKKMARHVLSLTDTQLNELVAGGQFEEVTKNA